MLSRCLGRLGFSLKSSGLGGREDPHPHATIPGQPPARKEPAAVLPGGRSQATAARSASLQLWGARRGRDCPRGLRASLEEEKGFSFSLRKFMFTDAGLDSEMPHAQPVASNLKSPFPN